MSEHTNPEEEPLFYDMLDEAGKAWYDRLIDAINAGGYEELAKKLAEDEAEVERELAANSQLDR